MAVNIASLTISDHQEKYDSMRKKHIYERRRRLLTTDMEYDKSNSTVIVWSRTGLVSPDYLHALLGGEDVEIRHHWVDALAFSSASTVIFNNPVVAYESSKKLRTSSKSMAAVSFSTFFGAQVEAEIRHPEFEGSMTPVVIKAGTPLRPEQKTGFENTLLDFGPCERIRFCRHDEAYGTVCTAEYRFAAHAIAARSVLDGLVTEESGRVAIELEMTPKVRGVLGYVKEYFV